MSSVRVVRDLPVQRTIRDVHVPMVEPSDTTPNPLVYQGRASDIVLYNHPIRYRTGSERKVAPLPLELQERSLDKREREYNARMARKLDRHSEITHPPIARMHPDWNMGDCPARIEKPVSKTKRALRRVRANMRYGLALAEKARRDALIASVNAVPMYYLCDDTDDLVDETTHLSLARAFVARNRGYTIQDADGKVLE